MNEQTNWWEPIFSGQLEVGLNKEKLVDIEQEAFLYFDESSAELEPHS